MQTEVLGRPLVGSAENAALGEEQWAIRIQYKPHAAFLYLYAI